MKRAIILSILLAMLGSVSAQSLSSQSIMGAQAEARAFEYRSDSVELSFTLDMSQFDLDSKESVVITPLIASAKSSVALPAIVVRGRSGARSYKRAMSLGNVDEFYGDLYKTPYRVVDHYGEGRDQILRDNNSLSYAYTIPYEQWMAQSYIALNGVVYSCCSSASAGRISLGQNMLSADIPEVGVYNFIPRVNLVKPAKVAVKRRDIKHSSHIIFKVNSSQIVTSLFDNQKELDLIDGMMESVISDEDYTITAVNIVGYASPEGRLESNHRLSESRAKAIQAHLLEEYREVSPRLYNVEFGGENWKDLVPMVEQSDLHDKGVIVDIVKHVDLENGREKMLMDLNGGASYNYMLRNFFPSLRKVDIDVEFNVDAYDLDRIKEVIKRKPQNLSLEEMYRLSETYEVDSDEFLDIFLTAVAYFPNDQIALHNALASELHAGHLSDAAPFAARIDKQTTSAESANALGVYYTMTGDYDTARQLLQRAISLGSTDAEYNLEQMKIKAQHEAQIEQNNALKRKIYGDNAPL